jgi:prolyl oligopeptidase
MSQFFRSPILRAGLLCGACACGCPQLAVTHAQVPPTAAPAKTPMQYPDTKRIEVTDDYHGRKVSDPYRWLEDTESEETAAWIAAQNKVTQEYLKSIPEREPMRQRLEKLWNYERYSLPSRRGDNYVYTHNNGLQDQSVLYKASSLDAEREVLLDPNLLSEDGTVALSDMVRSDDGTLLAYSLADGGSDWRTWKVRDVATGKDLPDTIEWVKFSSIAWKPDGSGFFYGRYSEPIEGQELTGTNENQRLFFHQLGDDQSQDTLILERPDEPKWGFGPTVTDDGRYLVIPIRKWNR